MLDIGWSELAVIAVVALLVIGPKDLPRALYTVGKWMRAARKVTRDFQKHVDDMMREAELDEVRKGLQQAQNLNVRKQIENTIDPKGELKNAFDPTRNSGPAAGPATSATEAESAAKEPPRSGLAAGPDDPAPAVEAEAAKPEPAGATPNKAG